MPEGSSDLRTTVEVRIELKPGIFDAEADSVLKSLRLLGLAATAGVGSARLYRLTFAGVDAAGARVLAQRAVDRLLANPIVHRVEILPVPG